jgi:UDP-N-acetylmuramate--alanine ligase
MLSHLKHIYFLGIGGIGMSALARYFKSLGMKVSGYDKTASPLTMALESEGIEIHYDDRGENAAYQVDMVIYTPAVPKELQEFVYFNNSGIPMLKRAKILGEISKNYFTIAIAGTHGKTTITSMVTHFLNAAGIEVNAFIGGIANNFQSNLLLNPQAKIMVVEADEFDRSFLHLHPDIAIISSMDADHLDIYENKHYLRDSFYEFANNLKPGGTLILHEDLLPPPEFDKQIIRYGTSIGSNAQLIPQGIQNGKQYFAVSVLGKSYENLALSMPGHHNLLNATAALSVAFILHVQEQDLREAMESYLGVKRRFELRINSPKQVLIDDYAHHPTEIKAAIAAAREMNPQQDLMGIFQPHLYSRTRDFADDFAAALSAVDCLVLLEIYPARELPIQGVDSQMLLDKVQLKDNHHKYLLPKEKIVDFVKENNYPIVLIMGAGDIDRLVEPIEKSLKHDA